MLLYFSSFFTSFVLGQLDLQSQMVNCIKITTIRIFFSVKRCKQRIPATEPQKNEALHISAHMFLSDWKHSGRVL